MLLCKEKQWEQRERSAKENVSDSLVSENAKKLLKMKAILWPWVSWKGELDIKVNLTGAPGGLHCQLHIQLWLRS